MDVSSEKALIHYSEAYHRLYNRQPKDLRALDNGWVIVNGARMRLSELEHLTVQLQREYNQGREEKRGIVMRLLKWFQHN